MIATEMRAGQTVLGSGPRWNSSYCGRLSIVGVARLRGERILRLIY